MLPVAIFFSSDLYLRIVFTFLQVLSISEGNNIIFSINLNQKVQEKQFFYIEFSTVFKLTMLILQNQYLPNFILFEFLKTSSMHYKVQRDLEVKAFFLGPYFRSGSNLASSCLQLKIYGILLRKGMVFCYQNCSGLVWEKIVPVIEKNFWNSRLKAENFQKFY